MKFLVSVSNLAFNMLKKWIFLKEIFLIEFYSVTLSEHISFPKFSDCVRLHVGFGRLCRGN